MPVDLPTSLPPSRDDKATFAQRGNDAWAHLFSAWPQLNALEENVNTKEARAVEAEGVAATKAGEALTSANNAAMSKTDADAAKVAAVAAQVAAEDAFDSFDDRYLGAKADAPALDNDGNALLTGAIYFDTVIGGGSWRAWNSAAWVTAPVADASTVTNTPAGGITELNVQGAINWLDAAKAGKATVQALDAAKADKVLATRGAFVKSDTQSVAFIKTAAGTISLKSGTYIDVAGTLLTFGAATAVTMPVLTAGTDYAIYACADGSLRADASFSAPAGYTTANSRKIGGFHYSPGGHSGVPGGGNAVAQINEYSLWDLKFKPACQDPRGMALVAGGFWSDIYLTGVDHLINGSSKYNVTIADGASPPKVPAKFGGNGTTAYTSLNWWEAGEVMAHHGKRLPSYTEFAALAYGTTEASSIGVDPASTTWAAAYISKWGCAQASGNLWVWGANFGGGTAAAAWVANTVGHGSTYQQENAALFGGSWALASDSGSRASDWRNSPAFSGGSIAVRGVCAHLILE